MNTFKYNTNGLQEKHPEIYKDFFSTCTTVVSSPGGFLWSGNYLVLAGGIAISQNIPLRVYVGIEETSDKKITLGKCISYNRDDYQFVSYEINDYIKAEMIDYITKEVEKHIIKDKRLKGLKIHILSEMPIGYGVNASGALASSLVSALFLYYKKAQKSDFEKWEKMKTCELIQESLFDNIFKYVWKLELIFHGGLTSGSGAFQPFVASSSPVVYYIKSNKDQKNNRYNYDCDIGVQKDRNYDAIDDLEYNGFRLSEIDEDGSRFFFPFDFGLIGTGEASTSIIANRALNEFEDSLDELKQFSAKIADYQNKSCEREFNFYSNSLNTKNEESSIKDFYSLLSISSSKILFSLHQLNQKCLSLKNFRELNLNLKKYYHLFRALDIMHPFSGRVYDTIDNKMSKYEDEYGLGLKFLNVSHGGYLLFVIGSDRSKQKLKQMVEETSQELDQKIAIDWIFSSDGLESRGVIVEQEIDKENYSKFITSGTIQVMHLAGDFGTHNDIYAFEEFNKVREKFDVLIDPIRNEIFVQGEKLNSKDLKSTTQTIALLKILIDNYGHILSKDRLPQSNYLQDRNEFQSKIITPLIRAIEKRISKRIDLKIHGKIVDFSVSFEPNNVNFYYITKEF